MQLLDLLMNAACRLPLACHPLERWWLALQKPKVVVSQMSWEDAPALQASTVLGADLLYDPGTGPFSDAYVSCNDTEQTSSEQPFVARG